MADITDKMLRKLLAEVTPGPWQVLSEDAALVALAPDLAREVLRLRRENRRLRALDAEYGRVEAAIIMADPDFDGDSDHTNCGDRLVASVERLRDAARKVLKGASDD